MAAEKVENPDYSFLTTLVKALKAMAFVIIGAVSAALLTPDFVLAAKNTAAAVAAQVPYVGDLIGPTIGAAFVAFFAGIASAIENWRKNRLL